MLSLCSEANHLHILLHQYLFDLWDFAVLLLGISWWCEFKNMILRADICVQSHADIALVRGFLLGNAECFALTKIAEYTVWTLVPSPGTDISQNLNHGDAAGNLCSLVCCTVLSQAPGSLLQTLCRLVKRGCDCCHSKGFPCDETDFPNWWHFTSGGSAWQLVMQHVNSFGSSLWKLL